MKNMKLYKKALLILSLGTALNSCLDLDPQDQLADGNLWGQQMILSILQLISMVGPAISHR